MHVNLFISIIFYPLTVLLDFIHSIYVVKAIKHPHLDGRKLGLENRGACINIFYNMVSAYWREMFKRTWAFIGENTVN